MLETTSALLNGVPVPVKKQKDDSEDLAVEKYKENNMPVDIGIPANVLMYPIVFVLWHIKFYC